MRQPSSKLMMCAPFYRRVFSFAQPARASRSNGLMIVRGTSGAQLLFKRHVQLNVLLIPLKPRLTHAICRCCGGCVQSLAAPAAGDAAIAEQAEQPSAAVQVRE